MNIEQIRTTFPGRPIEYYPSIDSTMNASASRPLGTIVLADVQTAGRGRHGHSWHSEPGNGLYLSIVLQPAPLLTLALGLATAEAITRSTGIACDLRWPNDVLIGDRKVAGILVELVSGAAVGGIGINVNQDAFPSELASEATSLHLHAGHKFSRTEILLALIRAIEYFQALDNDSILRLFTQSSSYVSGRRVTVALPDGVAEGVTAGLDPSGYLVLRKDDGTGILILAGGVRAARS